MNRTSAKRVSFVRTIETTPGGADFWTAEDAARVSRLAAQELGEQAGPERLVAARAQLAWMSIADRRPELERLLARRASRLPGVLLPLLAFLLGVLSDQIGDSHQLNLLALPFILIIAWNLLMYLWLLLGAPLAALAGFRLPGRRWLATHLAGTPLPGLLRGRFAPARATLHARCLADWAGLNLRTGLLAAARSWHLAAAALVAGLIASMYFHALYTGYRVGWESTLLDATDVHAMVATVLGWLPLHFGPEVPDLATVEQMRFQAGGGLADARPWLHLLATLAFALVIVPRLLLAAFDSLLLRRLDTHFPLPLDEPYFRRLLLQSGHDTRDVLAIPHARALTPEAALALDGVVRRVCGAGSAPRLAGCVPFGGEDAPQLPPMPQAGGLLLLLFDMGATPEPEHQGVLIKAVRAQAGAAQQMIGVVDSAEFRRRFGEAGERLTQRRQLWAAFLAGHGLSCVCADVSAVAADALAEQLEAALAGKGPI